MESLSDLRLGHSVVHCVVASGHARDAFHRIERRLKLVEVRHVVRASGAGEHRAARNALPAQTATTTHRVRIPAICHQPASSAPHHAPREAAHTAHAVVLCRQPLRPRPTTCCSVQYNVRGAPPARRRRRSRPTGCWFQSQSITSNPSLVE